jgi:arylsulfatase A-like enzyme
MSNISRREFLKLLNLVPLTGLLQPLTELASSPSSGNGLNIIILVFDAWSALHLPLYGYPRKTMPNVEAFANNSIVYHNHYSAGTFTVPGTASILTGLYPWSHRALQLYGTIIEAQSAHHIFSALRSTDSTLAYTQNKWADLIVNQARSEIDTYIKSGSFDLNKPFYETPFFENDLSSAFLSMKKENASLFFGPMIDLWRTQKRSLDKTAYIKTYPRGLPDDISSFFTLKDVVDGAINTLQRIKQPTLAYLHFYPPHDPYTPTADFLNEFVGDRFQPRRKPIHPLAHQTDRTNPDRKRLAYDQFLASWDAEVGRLFDFLASSGLMNNSYIFVTSDHGELFERGEIGHFTRIIFEPLIHVPLFISTPDQKSRRDIYTRTSNVDLLPTITHLTHNPIPDWAEGNILPGLGGTEDADRSVFVLDAKQNSSFAPLTKFSASITKNDYRLTYYSYPGIQRFELYNLVKDPEELHDLYDKANDVARPMKNELLDNISKADKPYEK